MLEDGDGIDIVQLFNPRTQTWSEMRSMKIPRSGSGACVLDGKIYVIGRKQFSCLYERRIILEKKDQVKKQTIKIF